MGAPFMGGPTMGQMHPSLYMVGSTGRPPPRMMGRGGLHPGLGMGGMGMGMGMGMGPMGPMGMSAGPMGMGMGMPPPWACGGRRGFDRYEFDPEDMFDDEDEDDEEPFLRMLRHKRMQRMHAMRGGGMHGGGTAYGCGMPGMGMGTGMPPGGGGKSLRSLTSTTS